MKVTGIIRKVDRLGRFSLPIELRSSMGIKEKDVLEIYVEGDSVILRKRSPSCVFCGDTTDIIDFKGESVCPACLAELQTVI